MRLNGDMPMGETHIEKTGRQCVCGGDIVDVTQTIENKGLPVSGEKPLHFRRAEIERCCQKCGLLYSFMV